MQMDSLMEAASNPLTKRDIEEGLRKLGLDRGDVTEVHSSLSSFGKVRGGASTVVDALMNVVGEDGAGDLSKGVELAALSVCYLRPRRLSQFTKRSSIPIHLGYLASSAKWANSGVKPCQQQLRLCLRILRQRLPRL